MHHSTTIALLTTITSAIPAAATTFDHSAFDAILRQNVRDERVDYLNIRDHRFAELEGYLDRAASQDPAALSRDERLAFYLNVYNATMIHTVAERFVAGYTVSQKDFAVFDEPLVRVRSATMSLNDLEHKVIRKEFQDPRIHAALVCAARSCPPLHDRAFIGKTLDADLDRLMTKFVRDDSRNAVDTKHKKLYLSQIFNWYADDFGGKKELGRYVSKYLDRNVKKYAVDFQEYSWQLNIAAPRGRWVEVTKGGADLKSPGEGQPLGKVPGKSVLEVLGESGKKVEVRRPFGKGIAYLDRGATKPYTK